MREEYLDAISELEEALSPFHLESDGEWTNYEFNTSTIRVAIQALEKQIPKKPKTDDNRILCPTCNLLIAYNKSIEQHCWTCGQNLEGCVIK